MLRHFSSRLTKSEENSSKEINQLLKARIQMQQVIKAANQTRRHGIQFGKIIKDSLIRLVHFFRNLLIKLMTIKLTFVPVLIICFFPILILMMIPNFVSGERANYNIPKESVLVEKDFVFPLPKEFKYVSAHYGYYAPFGQKIRHYGTDFPAPIGTPIVAIADGTIIEANEYKEQQGLKSVGILHKDNLVSRYMHVDRYFVKIGEEIKQGEVIAVVGNNGPSTGPHLHLQLESDYTKGLGKTAFDARYLFPSILGEAPEELEFTP